MSSRISLMSNEGSKTCEGHTVEAGWRVHYKRVGTISHKGSFPGVSLGVWEVSTGSLAHRISDDIVQCPSAYHQ
jgi:hypothetical protein